MDARWLLLGFGLLFAGLTVAFAQRGDGLQALVAGVHAVGALGLFWWYSTHDETVEVRLPGFG